MSQPHFSRGRLRKRKKSYANAPGDRQVVNVKSIHMDETNAPETDPSVTPIC